jgi:hypothetical protein
MPKPTQQMTEREEVLHVVKTLRTKSAAMDLAYLDAMAKKHPEVKRAIYVFGISHEGHKVSTRELSLDEKEFISNLDRNGIFINGTLAANGMYEFELLAKNGALSGSKKTPVFVRVPSTSTDKPKASSKQVVGLLMKEVAKNNGALLLVYSGSKEDKQLVDTIQLLSKEQVKQLKSTSVER